MEYKAPNPKVTPRLIVHGGAGNIRFDTMTREKYTQYRHALLEIVSPRDQNLIRE